MSFLPCMDIRVQCWSQVRSGAFLCLVCSALRTQLTPFLPLLTCNHDPWQRRRGSETLSDAPSLSMSWKAHNGKARKANSGKF
jgi:hypothetical protein